MENKNIKVEKVDNQLVITVKCNHEIVDVCFLFNSLNSLNAPSEGKRMLMEVVGEAYENYVRNQDLPNKPNEKYFDDEFSKVKINKI